MDNGLVFVSSMERVIQHLGLAKGRFIVMGHSFGGRVGSFYAGLFPERISAMILLDTWGFKYQADHKARDSFKRGLQVVFRVEHAVATKSQPKYKYEDLLQRIIEGRSRQDSTFTREAAEIVLARHIRRVPGEDLYYFTPDQHLKYYEDFTPVFTLGQLRSLYSHVRCRVLILESTQSHRKHDEARDLRSVWKHQLGAEVEEVEGNHDVHINEPEKVAPRVARFLMDLAGEVGKSKL